MGRERPAWWPTAAAAATSILSSMLTVILLLVIQARATEREREARAEIARVQAQQQAALCGMVVLMDDAYRQTPATTPAGKNLADAIGQARVQLGCPPR